MDIFGVLRRDHIRARAFADRLAGGEESMPGESLDRLREEWEIHAKVEEKFLFPSLQSDPRIRGLTVRTRLEHARIRALFVELEAQAQGRKIPGLGPARVAALREALAGLTALEEDGLYRRAARILGAEEAEAMGCEVEDFREELLLLYGLAATSL